MPYIKAEERDGWNASMLELRYRIGKLDPFHGAGPMNYIITRLLMQWLGKGYGYAGLNAALGVLEAVKLELYRRVAAPYEDRKCRENGDVY